MGGPSFGNIHFAGTLRPSQVEASSVIREQLEKGEKRLHIVAPPGSGKTVLGLYVWSDLIRERTLVLSPNSAIQAQWAARTSLFDLDGKEEEISTDPRRPGLLTSLTYQALTMPIRGNQEIDVLARELWANKLIEDGEAQNLAIAETWQNDLCERNPEYFANRMSVYRKKARENTESSGDPLWELHSASKGHVKRLQKAGIGLIILDECHHLLHHWGDILTTLKDFFGDPVILGLTATPPDEANLESRDRYVSLLGEVDYHVPIPALVKNSATGQPNPPIPTISTFEFSIFSCPFAPIFLRIICLENLSICFLFKFKFIFPSIQILLHLLPFQVNCQFPQTQF